MSQLTRKEQPNAEALEFVYDKTGRRTYLNSSGGEVYYEYDAIGRMQKLQKQGASEAQYEYDAANRLTKKTLGNGCYTYFAYDQANRITQILSCKPESTPLAYFEYTYDAASRITQCQREDGTVIYYGYDEASRLTSEDWYDNSMTPIYAFAWDYDAVGNRIYQKRGNQETYYTYDAGNALIQKHEPGTGYSYYQYDSRGNCTLIQEPDGNVYFTYNHANLVTSIHHKTGAFNYFYYDSQLHRYAIEDSNGLAYFTWDSNGLNLLAEKDASGNTTAQYTHGYTPIQGIGSLVEAKKEVDSCTYYQYPIYDHRGTVVKLVDENGETVGEYHYNAWGLAFQEEEIGATNRFGWQSNWLKLTDSQEGLLLSPTRIYLAKEGQ